MGKMDLLNCKTTAPIPQPIIPAPIPQPIKGPCVKELDNIAEEEAPAVRAQKAGEGPCAANGEDCGKSRCCMDSESRCWEKNSRWAICMLDCVPGKHKNDAKQYQTPWSCTDLQKNGTSIPFAKTWHWVPR